jgi:hypothetical protein
MTLSLRQAWRLRGIQRELCRSQPALADIFQAFTQQNAGQPIDTREQLPPQGEAGECLPGGPAGGRVVSPGARPDTRVNWWLGVLAGSWICFVPQADCAQETPSRPVIQPGGEDRDTGH